MQRAKQTDELGIALVALAGVAELAAATGKPERARDLATLVVNHPVSWREIKERARTILLSIPGYLPVERPAELGEQAGALDVWGEVDRLLRELKDPL